MARLPVVARHLHIPLQSADDGVLLSMGRSYDLDGYLQAIAWALLALQLLSIVIGMIAESVSTAAHPLHFDAGFSISGWLAVLLTFVLARVFTEGALMREDLERTV